RNRSLPSGSSVISFGRSLSLWVMILKTELSICRKLPFSVVLLNTSAQNRGLGVFLLSQQGMRKATGLLFGIWFIRSTHLSYVSLAFTSPRPCRQAQGWS